MQYLVGLSNRKHLGDAFDPIKDAFPDQVDMAIMQTADPERWVQIERDAVADLAANGHAAPHTETGMPSITSKSVAHIPAPRSAETLSPASAAA